MFRYNNGFKKVLYWSKEKMLSHADTYSPAFSKDAYKAIENGEIPDKEMRKYSSFWHKNFDEMAKKTVIKLNLSRNAPLSVELQEGIKADQSVQFEENKYEYVDNVEDAQKGIIDAQKAAEVADKFADFDDAEKTRDGGKK
jgi:recombination protein RecT